MNTKYAVNVLLIINIVAFLIDQIFPLSHYMGLYYFGSPFFHIFQPVTYMFMHGGFMHLFFNMFALWMFGRSIEMAWGYKRFLIFYFVCGIGAALVQELGQLFGLINPYSMTVGASGAVYGILLAFGLTFPNERLFIIPIPIPIKAKYFVMGYVVIELLEGFGAADGVAHFAHLGGMLFGAILFLYWKRQTRRVGSHNIRVVYEQPSAGSGNYQKNEHATTTTDSLSEEERMKIDSILDKIRTQGYGSLSEDEKSTLFDASQK